MKTKNINFQNCEGVAFLKTIPSKSVDLILTDPPYITSRDSGMEKWVEHVNNQEAPGAANIKTEEDWKNFKSIRQWINFFRADEDLWGKKKKKQRCSAFKKMKKDYLKYGSIYGKKYAVKTNYGAWDSEFTLESLNEFIVEFYRILKDGGSCIIFFDIWKLTKLKEFLVYNDFKQLRFIEWIKTNPQPINSKRNYLTNCREIALTAVKKGSSTFHSQYDNGIYKHPLQGGKDRFHPTQKSLPLFEELVMKHSNPGDIIVDPFAGSATTGVAALKNGRKFYGCEIDKEFYDKSTERLQRTSTEQQTEERLHD
jgi:site-specific DNA-methyltransferase (adenine-specific)